MVCQVCVHWWKDTEVCIRLLWTRAIFSYHRFCIHDHFFTQNTRAHTAHILRHTCVHVYMFAVLWCVCACSGGSTSAVRRRNTSGQTGKFYLGDSVLPFLATTLIADQILSLVRLVLRTYMYMCTLCALFACLVLLWMPRTHMLCKACIHVHQNDSGDNHHRIHSDNASHSCIAHQTTDHFMYLCLQVLGAHTHAQFCAERF